MLHFYAVAEEVTFLAWAESMDSMDYYRVLRVTRTASEAEIKAAFHELALRCHPDQYVEEDVGVQRAATRVFKRAVEAYGILSKPELRAKYDTFVAKGRLRMTPEERAPETPAKKAVTFESMAQGAEAKKHAHRADRLLTLGQVENARIALIDASRLEPYNDALKASVRKLYSM